MTSELERRRRISTPQPRPDRPKGNNLSHSRFFAKPDLSLPKFDRQSIRDCCDKYVVNTVLLSAARVLREFGLELPVSVEIRVWDSNSDVPYMVLPERPRGTEHLGEQKLGALVTRSLGWAWRRCQRWWRGDEQCAYCAYGRAGRAPA